MLESRIRLPVPTGPAVLRCPFVVKEVWQPTAEACLSTLLTSLRTPRNRNASPLGLSLQEDLTGLVRYVADSDGEVMGKGSTIHFTSHCIIVAKTVSHKQLATQKLTAPNPYTFGKVFDPASITLFDDAMKEEGYGPSNTESITKVGVERRCSTRTVELSPPTVPRLLKAQHDFLAGCLDAVPHTINP